MAKSFPLSESIQDFGFSVLQPHWSWLMSGPFSFLRRGFLCTKEMFFCHCFHTSPVLFSSAKQPSCNGTWGLAGPSLSAHLWNWVLWNPSSLIYHLRFFCCSAHRRISFHQARFLKVFKILFHFSFRILVFIIPCLETNYICCLCSLNAWWRLVNCICEWRPVHKEWVRNISWAYEGRPTLLNRRPIPTVKAQTEGRSMDRRATLRACHHSCRNLFTSWGMEQWKLKILCSFPESCSWSRSALFSVNHSLTCCICPEIRDASLF